MGKKIVEIGKENHRWWHVFISLFYGGNRYYKIRQHIPDTPAGDYPVIGSRWECAVCNYVKEIYF